MLAAKTCESAAVEHGEPSPVLCEGLERWDWRGGRESRERGCMYNHSWFTLYSKNQHDIVKQLSSS